MSCGGQPPSCFFLFSIFSFPPAGKSPLCPPGPFFPLKTSARNKKGPFADTFMAGSLPGAVGSTCPMGWAMGLDSGTVGHRVPMQGCWPGMARGPHTQQCQPMQGCPWHLCVPMDNEGGCAIGLLCTPQPRRGTQAALGPPVTPTTTALGARRARCCPSPERGKGNLSEELLF